MGGVVAGRCHRLRSREPIPALLPRAPACSKDCSHGSSWSGISRVLPFLRVEWTWCHGCSIQMSSILHALDDGDDSHQVPEQLVQLCMFYWVTPSPTNLTTFLLDDFFDKSLRYMLAVWPCWPFSLFVDPLLGVLYGCQELMAKQGAPLDYIITHGLYTHTLWQSPEPLKLVRMTKHAWEDSEMTPVVYICFSQPCCWFLQLLSFSPPFNLLHLNSFVHAVEAPFWPPCFF